MPGESTFVPERLGAMVWLPYDFGVVVMPPADVRGRERIQRDSPGHWRVAGD